MSSTWSMVSCPAAPPRAEDIFAAPVHGRGAMLLHKLHETVGDGVFFDIVRGWARACRHANVSTAAFTDYAEARSGRDLTELWAVRLYGDDKPAAP